MKFPSFRPTHFASAQASHKFLPPVIKGADDVVYQQGKVYAYFSGEDIANTGTCSFQKASEYSSHISFHFSAHSQKILFFRLEQFISANITLHIEVEKYANITFVFSVKNNANTATKMHFSGNIYQNGELSILGLHTNKGEFLGEFSTCMLEERANCNISLLEIGRNLGKSDIRLENISHASHTFGNILTRCVLLQKAFSSIQCAPIIQKNSQNCSGHLDQKTLLLSPSARVYSIPFLAVSNNKVSASHKNSLVRFNKEDLFYLQSRGISHSSAIELLLDGFLMEIFRDVPEKNIQKCIAESVRHFLQSS
jgi:Fe-S cluster assembly scaffold protein SufB